MRLHGNVRMAEYYAATVDSLHYAQSVSSAPVALSSLAARDAVRRTRPYIVTAGTRSRDRQSRSESSPTSALWFRLHCTDAFRAALL